MQDAGHFVPTPPLSTYLYVFSTLVPLLCKVARKVCLCTTGFGAIRVWTSMLRMSSQRMRLIIQSC